jgi:hypothetical protein
MSHFFFAVAGELLFDFGDNGEQGNRDQRQGQNQCDHYVAALNTTALRNLGVAICNW